MTNQLSDGDRLPGVVYEPRSFALAETKDSENRIASALVFTMPNNQSVSVVLPRAALRALRDNLDKILPGMG